MATRSQQDNTGEGRREFESEIEKEIVKLNYYTEQVDELIESGDLKEMKLVACRVEVKYCRQIILR